MHPITSVTTVAIENVNCGDADYLFSECVWFNVPLDTL